MKGTIIGSDLLQTENSVKFLEINTNTTIYNDGADLLDYDSLFVMLGQNNITEFHFIWTEVDSHKPVNQPYKFKIYLKQKCIENGISFSDYAVPYGSVTVPYIEDTSNKFILRQAFDTTALVDETYCADKFEFFSLMSGSAYVPKTYQADTLVGIDSLNTIVDNGNNPNVLIKARYQNYDSEVYPELHKLSSDSELSTLKSETPGNHLLQEFIFDENNLVEGRYSIIRSIDIVYGSDLDVINMGSYRQSSTIPLTFTSTELVPGTTKLNKKSRYKYLTKELGKNYGIDYHTDDDSMILNFNGTLTDVDTIQIGDLVRSIDFTDFNDNHASNFEETKIETFGWNGTLEKSNETLVQIESTLQNIISTKVDTIYVRITLSDGRTWVDAPSATYFIEELGSTATRFEKVNKMYVGDKLVVTDSETNLLTTVEIVSLEMEHAQKTVYSLDFEPSDLFLVDVGDGLFGIQHNTCWCPWNYCGYYCNSSYCPGCGGGKI